MKISPTLTPKNISLTLRTACKKITSQSQPIFVDVKPADYSLPNKCTFNVREAVNCEGGSIEYGWLVTVWPKVLLDCIGHAIHVSDCSRKCVTPNIDKSARILFLPDSSLSFDFDDPQARMPHRMIPLIDDPSVARFILNEKKEIEIKCKYTRTSQSIVINADDTRELKRIEGEKTELFRRIFLRTKHHNEPCVCGSGRKFRKCCRSEMEAVGPVWNNFS